MKIVKDVFTIIDNMKKGDHFIFSGQMARCAISIPSNIAEGAGRSGQKDFARFLDIAIGSSFELETQLNLAIDRPNVVKSDVDQIVDELLEVQKMLFGLLKKKVRTE